MQDNYIESNEKKYYTRIPNIVDDMGLDPYAFRLYAHIRRVAGDAGACWQNTNTLAKHCKMAEGSISKAKQALVDSGLIKIEEKVNNGTRYHHITIIDIWAKNHATYARSPAESADSGGETKKNPSKNITPMAAQQRLGDSLPHHFEGWLELVKDSTNKQAATARMIATLFPDRFPDGIPKSFYKRVAKTAKNRYINSYGRLVQLVWQASSYRPTGDVLSYCIGLARNSGRPTEQQSSHPGDDIVECNGKRVIKVGQ